MNTCQCYCGCKTKLYSIEQSKDQRLCWTCYYEFWNRLRKTYGKGSHKGIKRTLTCCGGRQGHTKACAR